MGSKDRGEQQNNYRQDDIKKTDRRQFDGTALILKIREMQPTDSCWF